MLYDEIIKIVTLAGKLMLQAQDEELTVFDKEGTANFVTKHDKEIQFYLIQNLRQLIPEATFLAESCEYNTQLLITTFSQAPYFFAIGAEFFTTIASSPA